jgi:integrase
MKTGEASQRTIPKVVAEATRVWRDHYRAAHVDADNDHQGFWIAKGSGAVRPTTMAAAMRTATKARLGVAVSPPHRLRDASATFVVEGMPEHAPLASTLLRHRSEAMTREYTETAAQIDASRRLADHLADVHATTACEIRERRRRR